MKVRYGLHGSCPKCGCDATYHRLANRKAFSCSRCGGHIYPCVGTIFQDSRTPLTVWFYAIYLFVVTRHGVSGKELQRQLGVTYKCAYRMGMQIRKLMASIDADAFIALKGHVEIDEHAHGGRMPRSEGKPLENKTIIMGLKERGGHIVTQVIPDTTTQTLRKVVLETVQPKTTISTDQHSGYFLLGQSAYQHGSVNHSMKEWARTDHETGIRHHVTHVESFWCLFKYSVKSTHISISPKHIQTYLDEFTFRQNHRSERNRMFDRIIRAF